MSLAEPRADIHLHRIEVHAGPHELEDGETLTWHVRVGRTDNDLVFVGYLLRSEIEGYGQAQGFAFRLGRDDQSIALWTREQIVEWGALYAFETLWDTCRRALQAQASMMDFQFVLDAKAPEPELDFDEEAVPPSETAEAAS